MGFRFQKRIRILPGVSINLGKRGTSVSIGPRGLKTTISSRGVKHSIGLPGTGIRYETSYGGGRSGSASIPQVPTTVPACSDCGNRDEHVRFLKRLMGAIFG